MQAILLSDINTELLDEETWLKWREHGPDGNIKWTIGGSDVATIMNLSPWTTPLELYHRKKGILPVIKKEYNESNKKIGHLNESHVARLFEADLKEIYPEKNIQLYFDKHMYQCGERNENGSLKYPWMIVNYDAYIVIDGKIYLVEIKTTSPRNYDVIEKWKEGICPEYYECQCRYYMKALDVDGIFIVCAWDLRGLGEGRNFVFLERDKNVENYIIEECEKFISCLEHGIEPDLWSTNATLLKNYYERLYGPNEMLDDFEIPQEYREIVEKYISIEKSIEQKKKKLAYYEKMKNECIASLLPLYKDRQYGRFFLDEEHEVIIKSRQSYKHEQPYKEEYFKTKYPSEYDKYSQIKIDMASLKKENPTIYADIILPKIPSDSRSWNLQVKERKKI